MINTDHYVEHTGTNGKFHGTGNPGSSLQQNVKQNLIGYSPSSEKIKPTLPILTRSRSGFAFWSGRNSAFALWQCAHGWRYCRFFCVLEISGGGGYLFVQSSSRSLGWREPGGLEPGPISDTQAGFRCGDSRQGANGEQGRSGGSLGQGRYVAFAGDRAGKEGRSQGSAHGSA